MKSLLSVTCCLRTSSSSGLLLTSMHLDHKAIIVQSMWTPCFEMHCMWLKDISGLICDGCFWYANQFSTLDQHFVTGVVVVSVAKPGETPPPCTVPPGVLPEKRLPPIPLQSHPEVFWELERTHTPFLDLRMPLRPLEGVRKVLPALHRSLAEALDRAHGV